MAKAVSKMSSPKALWVWVIELFSIITGASFVLAAMIHAIIFRFWNLDFFTVATPSDVLMSGLSLVVKTAPLAAISVTCYRMPSFSRRWTIYVILLLFAVLFGVRRWIEFEYFQTEQTTTFSVLTFLWVYFPSANYLIAVLIAAFIAFGVRTEEHSLRDRASRGTWAFISFLTLIGGGAILLEYGSEGFEPPGLQMSAPPKDCRSHHMLWIGERSLVMRCEVTDEVVVHANTENVALITPAVGRMERSYAVYLTGSIAEKAQYRRERIEEIWRVERLKWRRQEERRLNQLDGRNINIADRDHDK